MRRRFIRLGVILFLLVWTGGPVTGWGEEANPLSAETMKRLEETKSLEAKKQAATTMWLKLKQEIRQERADAQAEVLFWFRTHERSHSYPQSEVDRMLRSGGYSPAALEGLAGGRNPFFKPLNPFPLRK